MVVIAVGLIAWRLSRNVPMGRKEEVWETKAQVVGWISAFLYRKLGLFLWSLFAGNGRRVEY